MGDDGCIGLKELYDNGAHTLAENQEDCVVFGMPKKAIEMGAVSEILSLDMIIHRIVDYAKKPLKDIINEKQEPAILLDDNTSSPASDLSK